MNNETTQRLTEAIYALTNELALHRIQAEQGPSQTGAAPFTSGDTVTVANPRHEWYGATGRVLDVNATHANITLPGHTRWIQTSHLEKAEKP